MKGFSQQYLAQLQQDISYVFVNQHLLHRALTHRSFQSKPCVHMERLEFLGDAVLGLVVAEYLHQAFPDEQEGYLSRMRAALVRKESLLLVGRKWQLSRLLRTGEGERQGNSIKSQSIIANAVEAVIGAVFLDAGWAASRDMILRAWQPLLQQLNTLDTRDAKSALQEKTQGMGLGLPQYTVQDIGAQVSPRFMARCSIQGKVMGQGQGERKKTAELAAAEVALVALSKEEGKS